MDDYRALARAKDGTASNVYCELTIYGFHINAREILAERHLSIKARALSALQGIPARDILKSIAVDHAIDAVLARL
ncbi:MAG: hypothetical protein KatS3mg087_1054 [Patescibacteria group bacterium]|nr:MAG: hypothetical protein KatS3mg087_1054 [Patescibacteria group bacterium]